MSRLRGLNRWAGLAANKIAAAEVAIAFDFRYRTDFLNPPEYEYVY